MSSTARVLTCEALGEGMYLCRLQFPNLVVVATVIGADAAPAIGAPLHGEVGLETIMACRPAALEQPDGFHPGPGFHLACGRITAVYEWGSFDLDLGPDGSLMLDSDEVPSAGLRLGDRLSIGFKDLTFGL